MIWIMGLKGKKLYLFWESLSYSVFSLACASVVAVTSVPVQRGNPRMVHPLAKPLAALSWASCRKGLCGIVRVQWVRRGGALREVVETM